MSAIPAKYWHQKKDGKIQCDLCPRGCTLEDGQRGFCYIRGRQDDKMFLYSYGQYSGMAVDPIEKKPLNHFLPGSSVLSFGTIGCNLGCKFCQNWNISKSRRMEDLGQRATPSEIVMMARQQNCRGLAFTYNEPIIFFEFAKDTAELAQTEGIKTVAVTAGYINPEPRTEFFNFLDGANVDLKGFSEHFYKKLANGSLQPVLETLEYIKQETNVWLEITTLLIPGENDSSKEIDRMTGWILDKLGPTVPLHLTAFHPDWKMTNVNRTPLATLLKARKIAKDNGLHYVYTGNVHSLEGSSTYCHNCQALLIERDGYSISIKNFGNQGQCKKCGTTLAGVF